MTLPAFVESVTRTLPSGRFAEVFVVRVRGKSFVLKLARAEALVREGTAPLDAASGMAFHTGGVGSFRLSPSEVLDAEIAVLVGPGRASFVAVEETGLHEGRRWALLEHVAEGSLSGAPLTMSDVHGIAELASALEGAGVRHGDVKPANVLRRPSGLVFCDPTSGLDPSTMLATSAYNPLYEASDVPALALCLGEALAGRPLARAHGGRRVLPLGASATVFDKEMRMLGRGRLADALLAVPRPRDVEEGVPDALDRLVWAGLGLSEHGGRVEKVPRVATAKEFAARLRRALG